MQIAILLFCFLCTFGFGSGFLFFFFYVLVLQYMFAAMRIGTTFLRLLSLVLTSEKLTFVFEASEYVSSSSMLPRTTVHPTQTAPDDTPYANGCFEFDLLLPVDYPDR